MVETKYCTYLEKELPISEFYSSQNGSKSKQYYRDSATRFNPNRKDKFKNRYNLPSNNCVYAFKDGDEIIYIGSSNNAGFRLNNHINNKSLTGNSSLKELNVLQRKQLTWFILWYGEDGQDAQRLNQEKELIKLHQPKYNKTWKNQTESL